MQISLKEWLEYPYRKMWMERVMKECLVPIEGEKPDLVAIEREIYGNKKPVIPKKPEKKISPWSLLMFYLVGLVFLTIGIGLFILIFLMIQSLF